MCYLAKAKCWTPIKHVQRYSKAHRPLPVDNLLYISEGAFPRALIYFFIFIVSCCCCLLLWLLFCLAFYFIFCFNYCCFWNLFCIFLIFYFFIFICIFIFLPLSMYIYIYTNLPVNAIVTLSHPQRGDSHGQELFLAPSADKQTCNYDTECSNVCLYIYIYI